MRRSACTFAVVAFVPLVASAFDWATWGPPSGGSSVARLGACRIATLTADFTDVNAGEPAGLEYTSVPAMPGRPDGTNPPFQRFMTGPPLQSIARDTVVATLDLNGLGGAPGVVVGIGDQKFQYGVELLDGTGSVIPAAAWSAGVTVTPYHLTYTGSGLIADRNSTFGAPPFGWASFDVQPTPADGAVLTNDGYNDAGGSYAQTGVTTLANLPAHTRWIRLRAKGRDYVDPQTGQHIPLIQSEGVQIYLGLPDQIHYAPDTSILMIPSVQVGAQKYQARLRNVGNFTFALECADALTVPDPALATYDAASAMLTLPSVKVEGTTYVDVRLRDLGNYTFVLESATPQP